MSERFGANHLREVAPVNRLHRASQRRPGRQSGEHQAPEGICGVTPGDRKRRRGNRPGAATSGTVNRATAARPWSCHVRVHCRACAWPLGVGHSTACC